MRIVRERLAHVVEYGLGPRLHILGHAGYSVSQREKLAFQAASPRGRVLHALTHCGL